MKMNVALALTVLLFMGLSGMAGCKKETHKNAVTPPASTKSGTEVTGEQLFKQLCAGCHPDGGNIINPKKTLHAAVLADYKIRTADDMEKILRNPGPGMRKFEPSAVSTNDAKLIYDYVVNTFR